MRRVIERLTTSNAPQAELDVAAARLEDYAEHLATHPRRERYLGFSESALADAEQADAEAEGGGHFDYSPLIGRSNPLAPPIDVEADAEGNVTARVVFGSAYEGPPGCVHGGYVAAAFDEVLGYAETFSGAPGMTGTLNVVYRTPDPAPHRGRVPREDHARRGPQDLRARHAARGRAALRRVRRDLRLDSRRPLSRADEGARRAKRAVSPREALPRGRRTESRQLESA